MIQNNFLVPFLRHSDCKPYHPENDPDVSDYLYGAIIFFVLNVRTFFHWVLKVVIDILHLRKSRSD